MSLLPPPPQIVPGHGWAEGRRPALMDSFFQVCSCRGRARWCEGCWSQGKGEGVALCWPYSAQLPGSWPPCSRWCWRLFLCGLKCCLSWAIALHCTPRCARGGVRLVVAFAALAANLRCKLMIAPPVIQVTARVDAAIAAHSAASESLLVKEYEGEGSDGAGEPVEARQGGSPIPSPTKRRSGHKQ